MLVKRILCSEGSVATWWTNKHRISVSSENIVTADSFANIKVSFTVVVSAPLGHSIILNLSIKYLARALTKFDYFWKMTLNDSPYFQSQHHSKAPPSATRTVSYDSTGDTPSDRNCFSLDFWAVRINTILEKGHQIRWQFVVEVISNFFFWFSTRPNKNNQTAEKYFQHRYWCWSINFEGLWSACSFLKESSAKEFLSNSFWMAVPTSSALSQDKIDRFRFKYNEHLTDGKRIMILKPCLRIRILRIYIEKSTRKRLKASEKM